MKLADRKLFFRPSSDHTLVSKKKLLYELLLDQIIFMSFIPKYYFFLATQIWKQSKKQSIFKM